MNSKVFNENRSNWYIIDTDKSNKQEAFKFISENGLFCLLSHDPSGTDKLLLNTNSITVLQKIREKYFIEETEKPKEIQQCYRHLDYILVI